MTSTLNAKTMQQLLQEDLGWLLKQPRTLEREHIQVTLEYLIQRLDNERTLEVFPPIYRKDGDE